MTGWFVDVRAAEVELRRLLEVAHELLELRAVEAELVAQLVPLLHRQVAPAEEVRDRVGLDDAEEEEVEDRRRRRASRARRAPCRLTKRDAHRASQARPTPPATEPSTVAALLALARRLRRRTKQHRSAPTPAIAPTTAIADDRPGAEATATAVRGRRDRREVRVRRRRVREEHRPDLRRLAQPALKRSVRYACRSASYAEHVVDGGVVEASSASGARSRRASSWSSSTFCCL